MTISYAVIKMAIDEWDPIGLLVIHSPSDEYDSESKGIFDRLSELTFTSIEALANIIFEVFVKSFGDDVFISGLDECKKIAEKILTE